MPKPRPCRKENQVNEYRIFFLQVVQTPTQQSHLQLYMLCSCHFLCLEDISLTLPLFVSLTLTCPLEFSSSIFPLRMCSPKLQFYMLSFMTPSKKLIITAHLPPGRHLIHFSFITLLGTVGRPFSLTYYHFLPCTLSHTSQSQPVCLGIFSE